MTRNYKEYKRLYEMKQSDVKMELVGTDKGLLKYEIENILNSLKIHDYNIMAQRYLVTIAMSMDDYEKFHEFHNFENPVFTTNSGQEYTLENWDTKIGWSGKVEVQYRYIPENVNESSNRDRWNNLPSSAFKLILSSVFDVEVPMELSLNRAMRQFKASFQPSSPYESLITMTLDNDEYEALYEWLNEARGYTYPFDKRHKYTIEEFSVRRKGNLVVEATYLVSLI